jgi:hypothetical protein
LTTIQTSSPAIARLVFIHGFSDVSPFHLEITDISLTFFLAW